MLQAEGWGGRTDTRRLEEIIGAADRTVVAVQDGRVIGFGRAVTDGVSNGYLSMVVVHPERRRRGIGRAVVERLVGDDDRLTWVLRAGHPGSDRFWSAVGFTRSEIAFERPRRR